MRQFRVSDQKRAAELLGKFRLVSRDEFHDELTELILNRALETTGPVGLYAEREIRKHLKVPNRLFKESRLKVRRAFGVGPNAVQPRMAYDKEVGSEGIVAQLITELCRARPDMFLNHPGPDQIRTKKMRAFFLITDLVASGRRARTYLESAWRVRSVRSWWSGGFLRFEVISFASTAKGNQSVRRHRCRPVVSSVIPCPDICSSFTDAVSKSLVRMCIEYDPRRFGDERSLGVGGLGVLIAFAHGAPNNAPNIFHRGGAHWAPLFPARVTSCVPRAHFGRDMSLEAIRRKLAALNEKVLARSPARRTADERTKISILLLAALNRSPRFDEVIAERTGLTVPEIVRLCSEFRGLRWIDDRRHLTDQGRAQLRHARKDARQRGMRAVKSVAPANENLYYPSSLRPPSL